MDDFMEIKSIKPEEQKKILEEIKKRIDQKIKEGVFSKKEIRDIEEMKLHPLPDIQDVQSVFDELDFYKKD